ncbi:MAG: hypothetical protein QXD25_02405 [Nanopusillaceae archaeon]
MKSQYILLFLIMITFFFIYYVNSLENYYFYHSEIDRYIAEDFKIKLNLYNEDLVNNTYYELCLEYNRICYYNTTHIIVEYGDHIIILPIET